MTVAVTVANSVPAGSLGAAFSSFSASGLFTLTGVEDTLTAHAGGTQAAALALSSAKNYHRISVCATAADSVALPPATVGQAHFIRNDGAASCQVFGASPDTIDGVATATGVALPAGVGRWFVCTTATKWYTDESATTTGSGANVLATSPTLVTPNIGAATGTSLSLSGVVAPTAGMEISSVAGVKRFAWGNVASVDQDLATLFSNIAFANAGLSVEVQVITQSSTSAATSATFVGLRTGAGTWAFTAVNPIASGAGPTITPSGAGTTLTLGFSAAGQFGSALVKIAVQN